MDSDRLRTVMEEALSVCVQGVQLPGIAGAALGNAAFSSEQVGQVAAQLEQYGHGEITHSAEVELYLQISNTDVLSAIEATKFRVKVDASGDDLQAAASAEKDWAMAWERGIGPTTREPFASDLAIISEVYGCQVDEFFAVEPSADGQLRSH